MTTPTTDVVAQHRAKALASRGKFKVIEFEGFKFKVKCPSFARIEKATESGLKGFAYVVDMVITQTFALDENGNELGPVFEEAHRAELFGKDMGDPLITQINDALASLIDINKQVEAAKNA